MAKGGNIPRRKSDLDQLRDDIERLQQKHTDLAFKTYLLPNGTYDSFQAKLRERLYSVGDTNLQYRNLRHWEEKGLIPDGVNTDEHTWRRFNLVEVAWLEALFKIREFGLPISKALKVKKNVLKWDSNQNTYPLFEYYLARALTGSDDPYIAISSNGSSILLLSGELEVIKAMNKKSYSLLLISIKSLLGDLGVPVVPPSPMVVSREKEKLKVRPSTTNFAPKIELSEQVAEYMQKYGGENVLVKSRKGL